MVFPEAPILNALVLYPSILIRIIKPFDVGTV